MCGILIKCTVTYTVKGCTKSNRNASGSIVSIGLSESILKNKEKGRTINSTKKDIKRAINFVPG